MRLGVLLDEFPASFDDPPSDGETSPIKVDVLPSQRADLPRGRPRSGREAEVGRQRRVDLRGRLDEAADVGRVGQIQLLLARIAAATRSPPGSW